MLERERAVRSALIHDALERRTESPTIIGVEPGVESTGPGDAPFDRIPEQIRVRVPGPAVLGDDHPLQTRLPQHPRETVGGPLEILVGRELRTGERGHTRAR